MRRLTKQPATKSACSKGRCRDAPGAVLQTGQQAWPHTSPGGHSNANPFIMVHLVPGVLSLPRRRLRAVMGMLRVAETLRRMGVVIGTNISKMPNLTMEGAVNLPRRSSQSCGRTTSASFVKELGIRAITAQNGTRPRRQLRHMSARAPYALTILRPWQVARTTLTQLHYT